MDFNKLTLKAQEAVAAAQELARRMGNPELYPEHLQTRGLTPLMEQATPGIRRAEAATAGTKRPSVRKHHDPGSDPAHGEMV
jgi:hypothetical protein